LVLLAVCDAPEARAASLGRAASAPPVAQVSSFPLERGLLPPSALMALALLASMADAKESLKAEDGEGNEEVVTVSTALM